MAVIKDKPDIFGNPYFIKNGRGGRKDYGGYSPGVTGKVECFEGSTLNNCTSGAWGLFAMAEDNPKCKVGFVKYSDRYTNANTWWNDGKQSKWDRYERGLEPREGAIICYDGINGDPYGHVAYVTKVEGDKITLLSSGYGNDTPDGFNWRVVYRSQNYKWPTVDYLEFQGFIYPTKIDDKKEPSTVFPSTEGITTDQAIQKMAEDVIQGYYGNGFMRAERLYKVIQDRVNQIMWS